MLHQTRVPVLHRVGGYRHESFHRYSITVIFFVSVFCTQWSGGDGKVGFSLPSTKRWEEGLGVGLGPKSFGEFPHLPKKSLLWVLNQCVVFFVVGIPCSLDLCALLSLAFCAVFMVVITMHTGRVSIIFGLECAISPKKYIVKLY